jgi:hypothetical protein
VTADQIAHAEAKGFATIRMDVVAATSPDGADAEQQRLMDEIRAGFEIAKGVLVFAARTIDDPAYARLRPRV